MAWHLSPYLNLSIRLCDGGQYCKSSRRTKVSSGVHFHAVRPIKSPLKGSTFSCHRILPATRVELPFAKHTAVDWHRKRFERVRHKEAAFAGTKSELLDHPLTDLGAQNVDQCSLLAERSARVVIRRAQLKMWPTKRPNIHCKWKPFRNGKHLKGTNYTWYTGQIKPTHLPAACYIILLNAFHWLHHLSQLRQLKTWFIYDETLRRLHLHGPDTCCSRSFWNEKLMVTWNLDGIGSTINFSWDTFQLLTPKKWFSALHGFHCRNQLFRDE